MARLRRLVGGAVGGVLEGHPAVAGLREGTHHAAVEVTGRDGLLGEAGRLRPAVRRVELVAPQVDQLGHVGGREEGPLPVGVDPAHELVRDPVREVQVVRTAGVLTGVVAQLQELLDVGVPGLQVDRGRALAPAALVHRGDRGVEGLQERDDPVGVPVRTADQRTARTDPGVRKSDATRVLRETGHLVVAVVDGVQLVQRGVEEVAGRHLRVPRTGVEQRGGGGEVVEAAHEPVERRDLVQGPVRVVLGQARRHAQHEVLGRLDDLAGDRVPEQIAAVQGAQAEVAEAVVAVGVDQRVQPGRVQPDELRRAVGDQALAVTRGDRPGEGRDALRGGLRRDADRQQPGRQPGVDGVLGDEARGRLGGQFAQLRVVRVRGPAAQRGGGDPAGVGVGEVGGEVGQGTQQSGTGTVRLHQDLLPLLLCESGS